MRAMRVAGIGVRLLHGAVTIEDIHMVGKRRVGILNEPCPHYWVGKAGSIGHTAASVQRKSDRSEETERDRQQ